MLSGCARKYEVFNILDFQQKSYILQEEKQTLLLQASCMNHECLFVLNDFLGSPVASKKFFKGEFKNTKFLPPTPQYDDVFFYIIKNPDQRVFVLGGIEVRELDE